MLQNNIIIGLARRYSNTIFLFAAHSPGSRPGSLGEAGAGFVDWYNLPWKLIHYSAIAISYIPVCIFAEPGGGISPTNLHSQVLPGTDDDLSLCRV